MAVLRRACIVAFAFAGTAGATPLPPPTPCNTAVWAIDDAMKKTLDQGSPGMLVMAADGRQPMLLRTNGWANLEHRAPLRRESVFAIASITKQFTAAAILQLAEQGKLRIDDPLSKYLPELPQASRVTLYQLLVQTSGLPDYAEDPAGDKTKSVARTPQEMLAWIARLEPKFNFNPGSKWAYSNSNYVLLGLVAERVGGLPLAQLFEERLFKPAGLRHTAFDDHRDIVPFRVQGYRKSKTDPSGFANADWISPTIRGPAGGLRSTPDDLMRWSDALFGGRILKPESLRLMISPGKLNDGRTTKLGMPEAWQKGLNSDYGMGVFVTPTPHGPRIWHSGDTDGFSTWLGHYPDSKVTIALLQNSESADMDRDTIAERVFELRDKRCTAGGALLQ